jgi:F-type H+-transporting ATPase subunit f
MQRVVSFYEKLPRGSAPDVKPKGLLGRYQARYFGKNASAARMFVPCICLDLMRWAADCSFSLALIHVIAFVVAIGYAQNYYFHLRKLVKVD